MFFNVLFLMVLYGFMWSYLVSSWFSMGLLRASLSNLNGGFRGFSEVAVRAGKPTKKRPNITIEKLDLQIEKSV